MLRASEKGWWSLLWSIPADVDLGVREYDLERAPTGPVDFITALACKGWHVLILIIVSVLGSRAIIVRIVAVTAGSGRRDRGGRSPLLPVSGALIVWFVSVTSSSRRGDHGVGPRLPV